MRSVVDTESTPAEEKSQCLPKLKLADARVLRQCMQRSNREFPATHQHLSSRSVDVACRRRCPFYTEKLVSQSSCMLLPDHIAAACALESCCLLSMASSPSCQARSNDQARSHTVHLSLDSSVCTSLTRLKQIALVQSEHFSLILGIYA